MGERNPDSGAATEGTPSGRLVEVARVMATLGCTAFGGPAAHIAMLREEVVVRRRWMSEQELLDYLAASSLIPGPTSTELILHAGRVRAGLPGLWVAGLCFTLPAVALTTLLAAAYTRYGSLPDAAPVLAGVQAGVLVIVAGAAQGLGRSVLKDRLHWLLAAAALVGALVRLPDLLLLGGAGAIGAAVRGGRLSPGLRGVPALPALWPAGIGIAGLAPGPLGLFLYFLLIGGTLFGSGYLLVSYLESGLVNTLGWLTRQQLLDAVAAGHLTPGPLFSTAAFVGYLVAGVPGAAAAAAGIFAPGFLLVGASHGWVSRLRSSTAASGFLDAVNAACIGLLAGTTLWLATTGLQGIRGWAILGCCAVLHLGLRWPAAGVLGLAAGLGWVLRGVG